MELDLFNIIKFQRVMFLASVFLTVATVVLFALNIFFSERVRVSVKKKVKEEKIGFFDESPLELDKSSDSIKVEKKESLKLSLDSEIESKENKEKGKEIKEKETKEKPKTGERKSIFDLKDL